MARVWTQLNNFPEAVQGFGFVDNGIPWVCNTDNNKLWYYNVAGDAWTLGATNAPAMTKPLYHNGHLYVLQSGYNGNDGNTYRFYRCDDLVNGVWTELAPAPSYKACLGGGPRFGYGDYIYTGGGDNYPYTQNSEWYRYTISTNSWAQLANIPRPLNPGCPNQLQVVGGYAYAPITKNSFFTWGPETYRIDVATGAWTNENANCPVPGNKWWWYSSVAVDTKIYLFGGEDDVNERYYTYEYDTVAKTWARLADNPYEYVSRPAVFALNGAIYVVGGANEMGSRTRVQKFADPNTAPTCALTVDSVVNRTVTATPTASDSDGTIADITLHWGDDTATTGCTSGQSYSHTYAPAGGTFGLYAVATDNGGATGQSATHQAVIDPNSAPVCSFTATVDPSDNRTLTVNANGSSDPDGTIASWRFQPYEDADWIAGTLGQAAEYVYAAHGSYTLTVEVTDNEGMTATQTVLIDATNVAPVASATRVLVDRTLTLTDTSTDSDGEVIAVSVDWGDTYGSEIGPGGTGTHTYPNSAATYTVTVTAIDDDGAMATRTYLITIALLTGDWIGTADALLLLTDASAIVPPAGTTISAYAWAWDDGTPPGSGLGAAHQYAHGGWYTVTLSVTLSDGTIHTMAKEFHMATITKITPLIATRGSNGDTITITGSGFGEAGGSVSLGGQTAIAGTWSDTSITVKAHAGAALGAQDVIVTLADNLVLTKQGGVFLYDATEQFDRDELRLGKLGKLYIDGVHVGFTEDTVEIDRQFDTVDFKPNDRNAVVKTFTVGVTDGLKFTLSQVDGANLALVFGGVYDSVGKRVTLTGNDRVGEHSIAFLDALGVIYTFPRCQITAPPAVTLSATEKIKLPLSWRVLSLDNAAETAGYIQFPA